MSIVTEPVDQEPAKTPAPLDPAPRPLLGYTVGIGLVLEIGLRGGLSNAGVALAFVLTVRVLWAEGRLAQRQCRLIAAAATVPAGFLVFRASPWLASLARTRTRTSQSPWEDEDTASGVIRPERRAP